MGWRRFAAGACACGGSGGGAGDGSAHLTISANAVAGGKNAEEAAWIEDWVIPRFEEAQAANGVEVSVSFEPSGVDDEQYKTKTALDLQAGAGPDIITLDGIWVGEFAQAGYIEPLTAGQLEWDGWAQIPEAVRQLAGFEDELYGIPWGTDGRVLAATLAQGSGSPRLDAAALAHALKRWRFTPALANGAAIEAERDITVTFRLADARS